MFSHRFIIQFIIVSTATTRRAHAFIVPPAAVPTAVPTAVPLHDDVKTDFSSPRKLSRHQQPYTYSYSYSYSYSYQQRGTLLVRYAVATNEEEDDGWNDDDDINDNNNEQKNNKQPTNDKSNDNKRSPNNGDNNNNNPNNNNNNNNNNKNNKNILNLLNPYEAGVQLRQKIDRTFQLNLGTTNKQLTPKQKSIYYLDDRFLEGDATTTTTNSNNNNNNIDNGISQGALAFVKRSKELMEKDDFDLLYDDNDYIPEVLVIGATSEIGRIVVKRLLLSNKFKVRVLVHNLYSNTLNMLGTGVTYCQGELYNMESLEYALTDVDKIIFCESPPQKDELDYNIKFNQFVQDTLTTTGTVTGTGTGTKDDDTNDDVVDKEGDTNDKQITGTDTDSGTALEREMQQITELMEMKAKIAKQVDCIGMKNVLSAYQNVRHADYGTSQAAKRSLFKFQKREEDFGLFSIHFDDDDDDDDDDDSSDMMDDIYGDMDSDMGIKGGSASGNNYDYEDEYDKYGQYDTSTNDVYGGDEYQDDTYMDDKYEKENVYSTHLNKKKREMLTSLQRQQQQQSSSSSSKMSPTKTTTPTTTIKTQVNWMRNKFNHGVFVGKLPKATSTTTTASTTISNPTQGGSEASIISSRLSSREDPDKGIDLSNGFAGFVCRICSDGKNYEAFLRTSEYELNGIEYVCKFKASSKKKSSQKNRSNNNGGGGNSGTNRSINKFATVRLPFSKFVPVVRRPKRRGKKVKDDVEVSRRKLFDGKDVQNIGFRVNSADNIESNNNMNNSGMRGKNNKNKNSNMISFYLSLSYIKVYRTQPEPEFIYLSDARLGGVHDGMVNHDLKQIILSGKDNDPNTKGNDVDDIDSDATTIFDEEEAKRVLANRNDRSGQELYYKYCGEEMLKHSGLSYSIIRVPELNELASGEFSTLKLKQSNDNLTAVSRAEVAAVCESTLLDPNARNICFYLTKAKPGDESIDIDPNISLQFLRLDSET